MPEELVLQLQGIGKSFFGTTVLRNVNLSVKPGEIHALVGENGAGKSTLMNILFGMPVIKDTGGFEGQVVFDGNAVKMESPRQAMELGIGMVHQEFMLLPGFTATENIKLNREITTKNPVSAIFGKDFEKLDIKHMREDSRAAISKLGLSIEDWVTVAGLPVGYKQFIEIAREIDKKNVKLLVLDEPTAVLTETEADKLLDAMKKLAASGIAMLFITHRLDEVLAVADNITILRDGEVVASMPRADAKVERIAEIMVGRSIERTALPKRVKEPTDDDVIVTINDLRVNMIGENVKGVDLRIRRGEILGIGGLAGHGKVGIANGVMGLFGSSGTVTKDGRTIKLNNPYEALSSKMAFVSEDRRGTGLLLEDTIELNMAMTAMQVQNRYLRPGLFNPLRLADPKAIREYALKMIEDLDIRCTGPTQQVRRLSGGNQQKVCLARAFALEPELMWVSEPTRGIDVGAKELVLDELVNLNRSLGMTIVMTSSELAELRKICDRISIVYEGRVAGVLSPEASDVEFGMMMAGETLKGKGVKVQ